MYLLYEWWQSDFELVKVARKNEITIDDVIEFDMDISLIKKLIKHNKNVEKYLSRLNHIINNLIINYR